MGAAIEISKTLDTETAPKDFWDAGQALMMIATGDEARACDIVGRTDIDDLGWSLGCAMAALECACRCYAPREAGQAQHGVRTFGKAWGDQHVALREITPDQLGGLRLLFAGEQIVFGINRALEWGSLRFLRAEVADLAAKVRQEARQEALRNLMAAARLRHKPWLSIAGAIRVAMMELANGRERHLAALCPTKGVPSKFPPAWLIYLLGVEEAERQQQRCLSLWVKARDRLLDDLAWARISARGEIAGARSDIPPDEWAQKDCLSVVDNSLGTRKNISIGSGSRKTKTALDKHGFCTANTNNPKSIRGRPHAYNWSEYLREAHGFRDRSLHLYDGGVPRSVIKKYMDEWCSLNWPKCPGNSQSLERLKQVR